MTTQMKIALVKIHSACKSKSNAIRIKNKKVQDQHTCNQLGIQTEAPSH